MHLNEAIEKFKLWRGYKVKQGTVKGYDMILRQFCVFMRNSHIEEVKLDDITTWFELMRQLAWDHNSFIPKAQALRKFFEFYHHQNFKIIDPWLIPIPKKEYKIPRIANEESYQKLLSIIPHDTNDPRHIRNTAIINILWDTGARNGEVLALDVPDLDLQKQKALIPTEKSQGARPIREIFWTNPTNKNIERWIEKRVEISKKRSFAEPDALFVSICSGALANTAGKRLTLKGVGEMLRHYCNRAEIPYMNAHSFRHHMGHDIINKGGSAADVMNILGHASLSSSSIYTMMTNQELESRYRSFKGA